jgi:phosphoglucomutase
MNPNHYLAAAYLLSIRSSPRLAQDAGVGKTLVSKQHDRSRRE